VQSINSLLFYHRCAALLPPSPCGAGFRSAGDPWCY
jgi:hypothetical protein